MTTITSTIVLLTNGSSGSLSLIATLTLIWLLVQREITSDLKSTRAQQVASTLHVTIMPLLIGFALILIVRVINAIP